AQSALRTAETLHTLAGVDATEQSDAAYDKVARFNEHTWGAANPWEDAEEGGDSGGLQWTRKSSGAYAAQDDASDLLHAATRRFGAALSDAGAGADVRGALVSFAVFNPATWARTDVVRAFLPRDVVDTGCRSRSWTPGRASGCRTMRRRSIRRSGRPGRSGGTCRRWSRTCRATATYA